MSEEHDDIDWGERAKELEREADRIEGERSTRNAEVPSTAEQLKEDLAKPLETLRRLAEQ